MPINSASTGFHELNALLTRLNREGGFPLSLLTDIQGFLIASSAEEGQNPEYQSAAVALIQKTIGQAGELLGLARMEEVSMHTSDGKRLICRPFQANNLELILAVTAANKKQSYRRITNQAIHEISDILRGCSD